MPFAINQAAAYIIEFPARRSISQNLNIFRLGKSKQAMLLSKEVRGHGRASFDGVFTTLSISFGQLRRHSPESVYLLSIMSLDSTEISDTIFTKNIPEYINFDHLFEHNLVPLINLSLVHPEIGGSSFGIRRLLQLAMREWLEERGDFKRSLDRARQLILLAMTGSEEQFEQCGLCKMIVPHAETVLQHELADPDEKQRLDHGTLLFRLVFYARFKGDLKNAFDKAVQSREILTRFLDPDKDGLLSAVMQLISDLLSGLGERAVAIRFQEAALDRRVETFGPAHIESRISLQIMADISGLLQENGQPEEAQEIANRALAGLKRHAHREGTGVLTAKRILTLVYQNRGRMKQSKAMFKELLRQQSDLRGEESIEAIMAAGDLADFICRATNTIELFLYKYLLRTVSNLSSAQIIQRQSASHLV